jgi:hypothetical protein
MLQEMIKAGAGNRATPKRIIVSPTMFKAAEMILKSNVTLLPVHSYEIEVDFND